MFKTAPVQRPKPPTRRRPRPASDSSLQAKATPAARKTAPTTRFGTNSLRFSPQISTWTLLAAVTTLCFPFGLGRAPPKQLLPLRTFPATTTSFRPPTFNLTFQTFPLPLVQPITSWSALSVLPTPIPAPLGAGLNSIFPITSATTRRRFSLRFRQRAPILVTLHSRSLLRARIFSTLRFLILTIPRPHSVPPSPLLTSVPLK